MFLTGHTNNFLLSNGLHLPMTTITRSATIKMKHDVSRRIIRTIIIFATIGLNNYPGEAFPRSAIYSEFVPCKSIKESTIRNYQTTFLKSTLDDEVNPHDTSTDEEFQLIQLLSPPENCKATEMSGTDLAYIGDAVFELFTRSRHVWPPRRTSDLQNTVVSIVRAEHQSKLLQRIKDDFQLTEKETQIIMRGRNSVTRSKNRRNPAAYQDSTAFEALIGYLHVTDQNRCHELLKWLSDFVDDVV